MYLGKKIAFSALLEFHLGDPFVPSSSTGLSREASLNDDVFHGAAPAAHFCWSRQSSSSGLLTKGTVWHEAAGAEVLGMFCEKTYMLQIELTGVVLFRCFNSFYRNQNTHFSAKLL